MGKPLAILLAVALVTRIPAIRAAFTLRWADLLGVGMLAGVGFTVALLVGELAYGFGSPPDHHAEIGDLTGSLIAAAIGGVVLAARAHRYQRSQ